MVGVKKKNEPNPDSDSFEIRSFQGNWLVLNTDEQETEISTYG